MLNVTHKTHEVTIDRFNRKVSASGSRATGQGSNQERGRRGFEAYS